MKTIKFRAFDVRGNRMIDIVGYVLAHNEIRIWYFKDESLVNESFKPSLLILRIFTGLLTADDRLEVYEGDIVQMHQFNHEGGDVTPSTEGYVKYDDDAACFGLMITKPGANRELEVGCFIPICDFYGLHEESWTVIGNIYEGVKS